MRTAEKIQKLSSSAALCLFSASGWACRRYLR